MNDNLDDIDRKILAELLRNGRVSHQELSERVDLSPSPCARRIKQLELSGHISGYSARISEAKMGFPFSVFVSVKLDQQVDNKLVEFETMVAQYSEVADCWLMTGRFDYLMRVVVRDLDEFESFLTGHLTKIAGVASIESSIPIRRVKDQATRLE